MRDLQSDVRAQQILQLKSAHAAKDGCKKGALLSECRHMEQLRVGAGWHGQSESCDEHTDSQVAPNPRREAFKDATPQGTLPADGSKKQWCSGTV